MDIIRTPCPNCKNPDENYRNPTEPIHLPRSRSSSKSVVCVPMICGKCGWTWEHDYEEGE